MGITTSSMMLENLWNKLIGFKEHRIVMVGLDAAGKTTILYNLKLGQVVTTLPTIGFNVESVRYNNTELTVWDVGGQDKIRRLWHHYYDGNQGIIFVIDSSDLNRVDEARQELHKLFQVDALRDAVLLVYANKQDLPDALSASELAQKLQLNSIPHSRKWYIQPCCATNKTGLYEGLDWLVKSVP